MKVKALLTLLIVGRLALPDMAAGEELSLTAADLFARAVTSDVQLSADRKAIELAVGELYEDDGPAAGYSYFPNEEQLSDRVWIKKELMVAQPAAGKGTLLVGGRGTFQAAINGRPVELKSAGMAGKYWQAFSISPEVLQGGKNEIVLSGEGKVWIARADDFAAGSSDRTTHPNRSAKSTDAGQKWDYDHLGPKGDIDGEYYVRLSLRQLRPRGMLMLPVMDAGNLAERAIAPPLAKLPALRVEMDIERGEGQLRIRSGTTIDAQAKDWSEWRGMNPDVEIDDLHGRFFQLSVELTTTDPLHSPRLAALRIIASTPQKTIGARGLKVVDFDNPEIVRSAIPFEYEPLDHPRLKQLRTQFELDDVVRDAMSEFELIERLARWSSSRWQKGHLGEDYPAWDALDILKPHADGTPVGGFCEQYNLVFLQACESFGICGRAVSIDVGDHGGKIKGSGHEVVELWSNEFRKWVYVDGNLAWYAFDAKSGTPLSLWELRSRQLDMLGGKQAVSTRIVHLAEGGQRWTGLDAWPAFLELRMIPRSNFLAERSPLPLNQGMRGWFWTGHFVWDDDAYPAGLLYGNRVSDRRNWEWRLNQVHYYLEATSELNELRVHLDTQTPSLDAFLAEIDDVAPQAVESGFIWKLHSGQNRLRVHARNIAGRAGSPSFVVVERP